MATPLLETLLAQNTAPDGWRPSYGRDFIDRGGLIFLGGFVSFALGAQLSGFAAFCAFVYASYFVARGIEHGWARTQFWLSTTAFALAAIAIIVPVLLSAGPLPAIVMTTAVGLSVASGVGRRIHPTRAMLLFAVPLVLWYLGLRASLIVRVLAWVSLGIALLVLALSRRDELHALAERVQGRVRLDSGEVYAIDRHHLLRLGSRLHHDEPGFTTGPRRPPAVRLTVFTASLPSPIGRVWIAHRGSERLPSPSGSELHRSIEGVPLVALFEHPSALTEALARGELDEALAGLARMRDPFVFIDGGNLRIETSSRGIRTEEALFAIGRAFAAKTEVTPSGIYR